MITISSSFDGGNIEVVSQNDPGDIQLNIRQDTGADFFQWFYFRLQGAIGQAVTLRILNASEATFVEGWQDYQAVASYDRKKWFRVPSRYENGELIVDVEVQKNSMYLAYFTPYSYEQHLDLLARSELSDSCHSDHIGSSVQGRDMTLLTIGQAEESRKKIWLIARQHPGETMASWFVEGFLQRLLDENDAFARQLLQQAVFYIVPHMNPDGAVSGNLRANAAGINLNREWVSPSEEGSPEVLCVQKHMEKTGCDLFLDIHGDEGIPYNYIITQQGTSASEKILNMEQTFQTAFMEASPDFQMTHGYAKGFFGSEIMTIASNWVGNRFQCPAMTLEMPFKDNADLPDKQHGWSAERCQCLGRSMVQPISHLLPQLD